jgi:hypothetical protein
MTTNTAEGERMSAYSLNLSHTAEQLKSFSPGSNIILAKPTEGAAPSVAWQVFRPFEDNKVTWEEQYGIYVSTASIDHGAVLTRLSRSGHPAIEKKLYKLEEDAAFGPPEDEAEAVAGSYYVENDYSDLPILTFGLFQDATVNGQLIEGNALSAAPVLQKSKAQMTPHTTVYIWVESNVKSNTVATKVTSPQTKVTFGGGVFDLSLAYDRESGLFIAES